MLRNILKTTPTAFREVETHAERRPAPSSYGSALSNESIYVRNTNREVIIRHVPANMTLVCESGGARILVLGDVYKGATVVAIGGGARVDVIGNVHEGATITSKGGGARVDVVGDVYERVTIATSGGGARVSVIGSIHDTSRVGAQGGGARIELHTSTNCRAVCYGGGAEVLRF